MSCYAILSPHLLRNLTNSMITVGHTVRTREGDNSVRKIAFRVFRTTEHHSHSIPLSWRYISSFFTNRIDLITLESVIYPANSNLKPIHVQANMFQACHKSHFLNKFQFCNYGFSHLQLSVISVELLVTGYISMR